MPVNDNSQAGCMLAEDLRRYYLDTMGVQVWQSLEPQPGDASAVVETGTAGSGNDETVWQQLQQAVSDCTLCELHTSRTQTVFGVGSPVADLLIIGEAPGRDEDLQGEPFVGRAGQLLNAMLAAIGFQREQVYIANILKCRPPNNRDPKPEEAAACNSWLQQQIELLQPGVILALGRIAAHNLLNTDRSLGALRSRQHSYAGIPLVVTYHPAYLLRKPVDKRKSWQDLKRVKMLLKNHGSST
ncbi:MAG: uracil-DNA glycosylase [Thiotrichales bacterium]|nr:MAG: uracil-DNA glycosylase [Thiotrichales bacterium]